MAKQGDTHASANDVLRPTDVARGEVTCSRALTPIWVVMVIQRVFSQGLTFHSFVTAVVAWHNANVQSTK